MKTIRNLIILVAIISIGIFIWYSKIATTEQKQQIRDFSQQFKQDLGNSPTEDQAGPISTTGSDTNYSSAYFFGGEPKPTTYPNQITVLKNKGFIVGYDEKRKDPAWVCYRVFKDDIETGPKRPSRFSVDERTKSKVSHNDYTNSGFDRGHMAPNYAIALRYGVEAQEETFLMSNIVPQNPNLNQGPWRELEDQVARNYGNSCEEVWVMTGPIYDDHPDFLKSGVEIPDAFYKIIVDQLPDKSIRAMAFIMPQNIDRKADIGNYLTSVDEIEKESGFDFMSNIEDQVEDSVEAVILKRVW